MDVEQTEKKIHPHCGIIFLSLRTTTLPLPIQPHKTCKTSSFFSSSPVAKVESVTQQQEIIPQKHASPVAWHPILLPVAPSIDSPAFQQEVEVPFYPGPI
jgi:hypothetical protein